MNCRKNLIQASQKECLSTVVTIHCFLGIQNANAVAPQSVTPPQQIQMQTLLTSTTINSMQKSIENLHKGKHPQMEQTVNEFPYPSRGEFNVGGSSKQQTKKQKQLRRVERKEAFYGNNELSADRSPNPNFQGRWRKEQSEAPTNDRKRSADDRFCSYHNSFAHWENNC